MKHALLAAAVLAAVGAAATSAAVEVVREGDVEGIVLVPGEVETDVPGFGCAVPVAVVHPPGVELDGLAVNAIVYDADGRRLQATGFRLEDATVAGAAYGTQFGFALPTCAAMAAVEVVQATCTVDGEVIADCTEAIAFAETEGGPRFLVERAQAAR